MNREKFPEKVGSSFAFYYWLMYSADSNYLAFPLNHFLCLDWTHSVVVLNLECSDYFQVPFRLTRMLVKAMEVSGIEGNFRSTCEIVMQVLRTNKDSVMAMMEAFVHDPLINWRLFTLPEVPHIPGQSRPTATGNPEEANGITNIPSPPQRGIRERELLQV